VDAEHVLDLAHQVERVAAKAVHLVHEGEDRDAAHAADFEEFSRLRLDALRRVDQHHRAVRRGQRAVGVLTEVVVARGVEDVHAQSRMIEGHHGAADRDAALLFERQPVAGRVAGGATRAHRTGLADRAAVEQQLFRQCGLAGVGVRDDGEGSPPLDLPPELARGEFRHLRPTI